jgi:hypothetical protein
MTDNNFEYSERQKQIIREAFPNPVLSPQDEIVRLRAERDALAQFAETRRVQINDLMDENERLRTSLEAATKELEVLKGNHNKKDYQIPWCSDGVAMNATRKVTDET